MYCTLPGPWTSSSDYYDTLARGGAPSDCSTAPNEYFRLRYKSAVHSSAPAPVAYSKHIPAWFAFPGAALSDRDLSATLLAFVVRNVLRTLCSTVHHGIGWWHKGPAIVFDRTHWAVPSGKKTPPRIPLVRTPCNRKRCVSSIACPGKDCNRLVRSPESKCPLPCRAFASLARARYAIESCLDHTRNYCCSHCRVASSFVSVQGTTTRAEASTTDNHSSQPAFLSYTSCARTRPCSR